MEKRLLVLDDVLEVVVYLISAARNVVGGPGQRASLLFLDCALRLLSQILDEEGSETPTILHEVSKEISSRRELLTLDAMAYVESLDDLTRIVARNMLERSKGNPTQ